MFCSTDLHPCKTRPDETSPCRGCTNKIEKSFECYSWGFPASQGALDSKCWSRTDDQLVSFDKIQSHHEKQSDPWAARPWRLGTQCSETFKEAAQSYQSLLCFNCHWSTAAFSSPHFNLKTRVHICFVWQDEALQEKSMSHHTALLTNSDHKDKMYPVLL